METEEIREKKEPKRLPVWACILLFALGLFVTFGLYSTIGFGVLSLILGDEARHPGLLGHMVAEAGMLLAVLTSAVILLYFERRPFSDLQGVPCQTLPAIPVAGWKQGAKDQCADSLRQGDAGPLWIRPGSGGGVHCG